MISGTSLDGIDAAIIRSDGETVERTTKVIHRPYSRGEQEQLKEALAEALLVAKETDVSLQIAHLKTYGKRNWSKLPAIWGFM